VNFPGSLSYDSYVQLLEGREKSYSNWHRPSCRGCWYADALRPGAAYFVLFDTVLAFAALASLLWLMRRVSWIAVLTAAIVVCLPQLLLYQAIVWKDVLFADATLAGFAAWHMPRSTGRCAACASPCSCMCAFLALAALTRQNGAWSCLCGRRASVYRIGGS